MQTDSTWDSLQVGGKNQSDSGWVCSSHSVSSHRLRWPFGQGQGSNNTRSCGINESSWLGGEYKKNIFNLHGVQKDFLSEKIDLPFRLRRRRMVEYTDVVEPGQPSSISAQMSPASGRDYAGWETGALLQDLLCRVYPGRIALVSSFGVESAVLLHMVASIDSTTPVVFVDTGRLFPETLAHRDALCAHLGLTAVRTAGPDARLVAQVDPTGTLWQSEADLCCWHRKMEPLEAALQGFDAWITGRKRFQSGMRGSLPVIEHQARWVSGRVKVNPLAGWSAADIAAYCTAHELPAHPLEAQGYRSVGCAPCTRSTVAGEAPRAGRWAGQGKTECGIHLARSVAVRS